MAKVVRLARWAGAGYGRGLLSASDAEDWPRQLDDAVAAGRFLYAVTFFLTAGTRP